MIQAGNAVSAWNYRSLARQYVPIELIFSLKTHAFRVSFRAMGEFGYLHYQLETIQGQIG